MRVLIVEDEIKIADAIKRSLELRLFAVDVVHTGDEGLAFALDEPYDLVILDYMLPGSIDGLDICKELRQKGKRMPILMLTAKDKVQDRVSGLMAGADDYLVKPFDLTELYARVHSLLRRPVQLQSDELRAGGVTLNTTTFAVQRDGIPIRLSQKEFSILEYLMRRQGETVTKESIIAHAWDYDADVLPNAVEACIRRLRHKVDLAFPGRPPLITTIYGFGYIIHA